MIIQVLPQTPYNFSYLASSATESVIVADNIPVAGARTIALSVRIHHLTLSAGASIEFKINGVDPSPTDGTVFISGGLGTTGNITSSSPNLVGLSAIISDPIYPFIRVTMLVTGPSSTGTTYFEVSADLVARTASARRTSRVGGDCACNRGSADPFLPAQGRFRKSGVPGPTPPGWSYDAPDSQLGCFCVSTVDNTWWEQPCETDGTAPACYGAGYVAGRCNGDKNPFKDPDKGWICK